jgi:DNA polymerase III subunit delta'
MFFKDIPGQSEIKERLIRSVLTNRVSHAQLFVGAEGAMKLPMAIAYARFLACNARIVPPENEQASDSCGECPSCVKFNKLAHPDLHFIFPVAASESVSKPISDAYLAHWRALWKEKQGVFSLNDWYQAMETENRQPIINAEDCNQIIKKLSYKSYESEYKIMIIWMVEKLFHAAAPRILKILEEPPDKTLFILIAQDQSMILNTILSRTQLIRFPKLHRSDITDWLLRHGYSAELSRRGALLADGNIHKAIDLVQADAAGAMFFENFRTWLRHCFKPQGSINELIAHSEMLAGTGREYQKRFLAYSLNLLRQSFIFGQTSTGADDHSEETDFIQKVTPFVHRKNIALYESLFNDAIYHIERNANPKVLFLDLSMKLVKLIKLPA